MARWVELRSPLLTLAEDPRVLDALRDTGAAEAPLRLDPAPLASLEGVADRILVRDRADRVRVELSPARIEREGARALPVRLAIPAVLSSDGTPLVSVAMEPLLWRERRFVWEGEEWLAAYRDVHDPPLKLSLAVPTTPHTTPFTDAARRGVLSLLVVLSGSVLLTVILSRHVSVPLARLTTAAEEVVLGRLDGNTIAEAGPDECAGWDARSTR